MGFSVRVAPGVRVRASSHGVRASLGPHGARVHVVTGGASFSSAARGRTTTSTSRTTMTLAQAAKAEEAGRLREAIDAITSLHRQSFSPATKRLSPPPPLVNAGRIRAELAAEAVKGMSLFDRAGRKAAKDASATAAEERIAREVAELRQQYDGYQRDLDAWWARLLANDPDVLLHELAAAFEDNEAAAAPLGTSDGEVTVVVLIPGIDAVPERYPTTTQAGNLSLKKMTKRDRDGFYNVLTAGYTLVTVKEAFAVAPGLRSVRIIAVRSGGMDAKGLRRGEVLLAARIRREAFDGVQWSAVDSPTILTDTADELLINPKGVTRVLSPLDLKKEPELAVVIESIDFGELDES